MSMELPVNRLKRNLREGRAQIGLWSQLTSPTVVEVLAGAGFDFLVLDTEHAPNELPMVLGQLRAMTGGNASGVVRAAWNDPVLFKRLLDVGAQSLLVPFVQDADEARRAVAAMRYPPHGIRGVAAATRASGYGRVKDYLTRAHDELCLLVQIETRGALGHLERIAAVEAWTEPHRPSDSRPTRHSGASSQPVAPRSTTRSGIRHGRSRASSPPRGRRATQARDRVAAWLSARCRPVMRQARRSRRSSPPVTA
jgi:hypothetical protein